MTENPRDPEIDPKQFIKLLIELGPLIVFFVANSRYGDIIVATKVFVAATLVALAAAKYLLGKIPVMLWVSGVLVTVFGGLSVWFADDRFIKVKPTLIYTLSALVLLGGLYFKRPLFKFVLGEAIKLTDEGWYKLQVRWASFFLFLAVLNELVWRNVSDDTWISFKLFGMFPLTIIFAVAQVGLMKRYELTEEVPK
jgi:intracellular septation protein